MNGVQVSVIIPTHNRPNKLTQTLSGLNDQTVDSSEYEIIVVDDGSSPAVVLPQTSLSPNCVLVRAEGIGRSTARNRGAGIAKGDLLLFVDDDIRVGQDFIEAHINAHREWPGALVVGAISLTDEALATRFGRFRHELEQNDVPAGRGLTRMRNLCTAANMSISRRSFEALSGFNSALASAEDQDFALRFTEDGGKIAFAPEASAIHDDDALDIRTYCRRVEWGAKHLVTFCRQHPDWPENVERDRVNGLLQPFREPLAQSLRKLLKLAISNRPAESVLFSVASLIERQAPNSRALDLIYRLLLGSHILRGYRSGLMLYPAISNKVQVQQFANRAAAAREHQ